MELILGGAHQGKLEYALKEFGLTEQDVAQAKLDKNKKIVDNLQDYIYNQLRVNLNPKDTIEAFIAESPDTIFICNEIGYGLVPIDPLERSYRETVGRICCLLAKKSKRVHRLVAGIPMVIKNA